jgi:DNA-binding transcriptional regulator YiaG
MPRFIAFPECFLFSPHVIDRLREFLRLNYITGAEVARRLGVRDKTVYSWLQGEFRPANPQRITAFLNSLPKEKSG